MNAHPLLPMRTRFIMTGARAAAALCLSICSTCLLAQTKSDQISFSGVMATASAAFTYSCGSGVILVDASSQTTRGAGNPSPSPGAVISIFGSDTCHGSDFFDSFFGPVQFSAVVHGAHVPESVTASGQLPSSGTSDILTFTMNVTASTTGTYKALSTTHETFPSGSGTVTLDTHLDEEIAFVAAGSLSASTNNLGRLTFTNQQFSTARSKQHSISITH